MAAWLRGAVIGLSFLYPLGVFFGLQYFDPRALVLLLIVLAGLRLLSLEKTPINHWLWLPLLAVLGLWTWLANSELGLKLYPVFVNASFFAFFAWSLRHPPSMIERFARLRDPNLPAAAIPYTRKVTIFWCGFFVANALAALVTSLWATDKVWALYNGLIAYLLMGAVFLGEWLIRRRVIGGAHA